MSIKVLPSRQRNGCGLRNAKRRAYFCKASRRVFPYFLTTEFLVFYRVLLLISEEVTFVGTCLL